MAHNPNYFIDNDIQPDGTYHGFEYALLDSPCDTKNGYVRVPDDVCTQLFAKFDVPSHADQYYSDVITTVTEDYDRFEDLLYTIATTYANNIYLLNLHHKTWLTYGDSQGWIGFDTCHAGDAWLDDLLYTIATTYANNIYLLNLHHKTWLTYGDSQGWIGFDTCHAGDAWLDDNNTLRPVVPYMKSNGDSTEYVTNNNGDNGDNNIDIAQPITNDMMGNITTVWNEQEVINECKRDSTEYVTNNNGDNGDNNIDIAQPITNDMMGNITTVWNEQEVINECKRIIDILRLGLAYKN